MQTLLRRSSALMCAPMCVVLSLLLLLLPVSTAWAQPGEVPESGTASGISLFPNVHDPEGARFLRGDSTADIWVLESRVPGKASEQAGIFRLDTEVALPPQLGVHPPGKSIEDSPIKRYDRKLAIGTMIDAQGNESPMAVVRFDIAVADGETMIYETVIKPLYHGESLAALVEVANEAADAMRSQRTSERAAPFTPAPPAVSQPPQAKSICPVYCRMDYRDELASCKDEQDACIIGVTGVAIGCVLACAALAPPAVPACLLPCGVVDIAGIIACVLVKRACDRRAGVDLRNCLRNCPSIEI